MEKQQVLEPVQQRNPEVLDQARMFVEELARVASLWDEQWVHTLQEVQVSRDLGPIMCHHSILRFMNDYFFMSHEICSQCSAGD